MPATGTTDTTDAEGCFATCGFKRTVVVTVNCKATGMTTGTGKSVERKVCYKIIIKIWCNRIVFFDI